VSAGNTVFDFRWVSNQVGMTRRRSRSTLQPLLPRSIKGGLVAYLARNAETGAGGSSYSQ
jgi:hypothetical protein